MDAPKITEGQFIADEAKKSVEAIQKSLADLKQEFGSAADPRAWTQAYPLAALGVAAVAGLAAGLVVTPTRRDALLAKLQTRYQARLQELEEHASKIDPDHAKKPKAAPKPSSPGSFWGTVLHEAFILAKPVITGVLAAKLKTAGSPSDNGHDSPTASSPAPAPAAPGPVTP